MPTYNFLNEETGEESEIRLKMAELDDYKANNPQLKAIISGGAICSAHRMGNGVMDKSGGGFKSVLQLIHSRTSGSCLDKTTNI